MFFFLLFFIFACPEICTFPVFLLLLSIFGFEQSLLSQADYKISIEQIATQHALSLL